MSVLDDVHLGNFWKHQTQIFTANFLRRFWWDWSQGKYDLPRFWRSVHDLFFVGSRPSIEFLQNSYKNCTKTDSLTRRQCIVLHVRHVRLVACAWCKFIMFYNDFIWIWGFLKIMVPDHPPTHRYDILNCPKRWGEFLRSVPSDFPQALDFSGGLQRLSLSGNWLRQNKMPKDFRFERWAPALFASQKGAQTKMMPASLL